MVFASLHLLDLLSCSRNPLLYASLFLLKLLDALCNLFQLAEVIPNCPLLCRKLQEHLECTERYRAITALDGPR